jgi:hypothetical protein
MRSSSREEVVGVFDALRADFKRALDLRCDALTTPERLALLESCEQIRRLLPAVEHPLINQLSEQADATELGGKLAPALANRLRITRAEASRRIHEAADLGERQALNGEPLEPVMPATAEAQRNGTIGTGHVAIIRSFWHRLPDFVDIETRHKAETNWPAWPASTAPTNWPGWPTPSPTASTPTATSPTWIEPGAAA